MQDLKDVTNNVHYENYRSKKLSGVAMTTTDGKAKAQTKYDRVYIEEETHHTRVVQGRVIKLAILVWCKVV